MWVIWLGGLEQGVRRGVETAGVFVVSHCDSIARADTPRSGSLPLARRLGAKPGDCTVYEDTDLGLEAARRAGMHWVDVRTL